MDLKRDMSWKSWFLGWGVFQFILKPDKTTDWCTCSSYLTDFQLIDTLWGSRLLYAPPPSKLWRWSAKKSTASDDESMPFPNPMVGFNLCQIGKSAFDPNSGNTSLMICNTLWTSVRDVANHERFLPLLGSDRGEGSPSVSALGTPASQKSYTLSAASNEWCEVYSCLSLI